MANNDFDLVGPLRRPWEYRFISGSPKEIQNYLTLIKPFDYYAWTFIAASVISVTIALVLIDTAFATWLKTSRRGILLQSIILEKTICQNYGHNY